LEEINYLYSLETFGIKLGLKNIKKLCQKLDNPQKNFQTIHIAGSNGKGSTAHFIASILEEAGFNVGLYTSPHLIKFNERIKINGKEITNNELKKEINHIRNIIQKYKLKTTFFEFTTTLAFDYFSKKKIDFAVIETGLGGRFDATNIINSKMNVITSISKEHTKILGNTLEKIAFEKAGIIHGGTAIVSVKEKETFNVINKKCEETKTKIFKTNNIIKAKQIKEKKYSQEFKTKGAFNSTFQIQMLGKYQIKNALTALAVITKLREQGTKIPLKAIKKGLKKTKIKARLEYISKKPNIIVDSSHNEEGIKETTKYIKKIKNKKILLIAFSKDKKIKGIAKNIAKEFQEIVISKSDFKPMPTKKIEKEFLKYNTNLICFENAKEAIEYSLNKVQKKDLMLITGSIYFTGKILEIIKFNKIIYGHKKILQAIR
jgi:dihydrofolate synthase / folylpolyglutamate synthase